MLRREVVELGYQRLCRLHGRKARDGQVDEWYRALSHRLTDEQFTHAIEASVEEDASFPNLKSLIEYGRADPDRGRYRGQHAYLYGMPLAEAVERSEDLHKGDIGIPIPDVPGEWASALYREGVDARTAELTFAVAVESEAAESGGLLPPPGQRFAFLQRVAERVRPKLYPTKAGPMREVMADSIAEELELPEAQVEEADDADGLEESSSAYREEWD